MKKYVILTLVIAVLVAAMIFTVTYFNNKDKDNNLTTIRLNEVTHSVFYAPQYVALSKGYFKDENLNVELTTAEGSDKVMTSVLAGQADIGLAGPETSIYVYNEGKEDYTEVFAGLTKRDGSFLVSRVDEKDFDFKNLKGKTIIPGRKGGVPYMTFEYVLKQNGLDTKKDLVLDDSIKFDLMAGAFSAGNADYVTLFEPTASMTEIAGKGYIVASIGEASGEIPYTAYAAKKSYIEENKGVIEGFTKAIYKGQQFVKEHSSKEIAEAIITYFPGTELDLLQKVIDRYKSVDVWSETPVISESSFDLLQTVMSEAGELKQKAPYEKIVNNTFAEKVIK